MSSEKITIQVDAIGNFSNLTGQVNNFKSQLKNLKLPDNITSKLEKSLDNMQEKASKFQSSLRKGISGKSDFSKLVKDAEAYRSAMSRLEKDLDSVGNKDFKVAILNSGEVQKAEAQLKKVLDVKDKLTTFGTKKGTGLISEAEVNRIQKLASTSPGLKKRFDEVFNSFQSGNIQKAISAIDSLTAHVQKYQTQMNNSKATPKKADTILTWTNGVKSSLQGVITEASRMEQVLNNVKAAQTDKIAGNYQKIAAGIRQANVEGRQFANAQLEMANRASLMNEQVGHLRTQANYFFGLQNVGRLIARGIREAAESVRDLDKAMTETAVVTEFSVSDMWNMLPEYTALANKLGATTQGAYETMTLYFQQGLDKQATFEIGEETMKMARIAGLDYADTTNMMTAALRGFNMELNQTSAKRVNDVYSELAAITASDTRELGLAMERTASIAHSANMDFGNVSAFLAQMIETTREAPENLGTAMKTIIARFQELKENPYSISEVEGEEVDFNRVDKALKSIGVDLMDNRDKFRDLDDVFLDISERWDGLSQTQQRYVATIAAGARQQSRFLAMVQNYDRLKELTDAAANSEGASEVQFSKTLESYESKVNKLKNAWQQFTMSLANNQAIKKGVDTLKDIITFGNKIIKTFGKVGDAIGGDFGKGLAELGASFGLGALGFKGLKGGANLGLRMLGNMTVKGATAKSGLFTGGVETPERTGYAAKNITNPIVNAINRVVAAIQNKPVDNKQNTGAKMSAWDTSQEMRRRRDEMYKIARDRDVKGYKSFGGTAIGKQFGGLAPEYQKQIYKSIPTIRKALQKGYAEAYKGLNLGKEGEAALNKHFRQVDQAIRSDRISAKDAFAHLYNPASVAEAIENPETAKKIKEALYNQMKSWSPSEAIKINEGLSKAADKRGLQGKERANWIKEQRELIAGNQLGVGREGTARLSKMEGAMTKVSAATSSAGQAVMGLGMALNAIGLSAVGSVFTTIGSGIMGIGMAAEGASVAVAGLSTALNFLKAHPIILALSAVSAALVGLYAYNKKWVSNTRKTGKDIVDTYTKTSEKTKAQIDNYKKYAEDWDTWSAGVDASGNNVSLNTEEYEAYQKAIKEITKDHPELIKGYNAQGQAIVDNNNALKEAIKLTQKEQEIAKNKYLDNGQKIIDAQKTKKRWKAGNELQQYSAHQLGLTGGAMGKTRVTQMQKEAQDIVKAAQEIKGADKVLADYGVTLDESGLITAQGMEVLRTKGDQINESIKALDSNPSEKVQKKLTSLNDAMAAYGKTTSDLEKVSKDTYDWALEYASSKGYDYLEDGLVAPFQQALERASEKGLNQQQLENEIDRIGSKYKDLGGNLENFKDIQESVNEAQSKLGETHNLDEYAETVEAATEPMDSWIAQLRASTDEADHIMADWLQNQKEIMLDYSKTAEATLNEGLNQDQQLFNSAANANKRYESKKEEITDYVSGITNMKAILDDALTDINLEGNGSLALEQAGISILGENFVKEAAKGDQYIEKVGGQLKKYQSWLQDSEGNALSLEESYGKFWDHIVEKGAKSEEKIEGLDGRLKDYFVELEDGSYELNEKMWSKLTDDQMNILAEQGFGMAGDFMSSFLNIGRQLGYYSSADPNRIMSGLVQQDERGSAVSTSGETVYKRESSFDEESRLANNSVTETEEIKKSLRDQGVEFLGSMAELTDKGAKPLKNMMTDLGVSGDKLIKTDKKGNKVDEFGYNFVKELQGLDYNKEEVSEAIGKAIKSNEFSDEEKESLKNVDKNFGQTWDSLLENKELGLEENKAPEEATAENTAQTAANTAALLAAEGKLDKNAYGYDDADKTNGEKSGLGYEHLKTILGKSGVDTMFQRMAEGKDAQGNKFTEEAYKQNMAIMQATRQQYAQDLNTMKLQAENSSGAEQEWWNNQIKNTQLAIDKIDEYTEAARENHDEKTQQNEDEKNSDDSKTKNKLENDEQEKNSDKSKTDEEKNSQQELNNLLQQDLTKLGIQKPEELINIDNIKEQFQAVQELKQNLSTIKTEDPNDILGNASNMDATLQKLQQVGIVGEQNANTLKRAFIDANINGIAKMDGSQLASLQSTLGVTEEELQQIAKEHNVTINTEDQDVDDTTKKISEIEKHPPVKVPVTIGGNEDGDKKGGVFGKLKDWFKDKLTIDTDDSKVDSTKQKVADLAQQTNKGAKFTISVPGLGSLTKAAKAYKAFGSGGTKKASVGLDSSKVSSGIDSAKSKVSSFGKAKANATIGATDNASSVIKSVKSKLNNLDGKKASTSVSVNVSPNYTGTWTKTVYVKEEKVHTGGFITNSGVTYRAQGGTIAIPRFKKKGTDTVPAMLTPGEYVQNKGAVDYFGVDFMRKINHKDLSGALQTLGSAAKGLSGRLGPKGRGGLTLTGEDGFEVAWIPSENRSMILGAKGPQMVNLPKDAVVWTNEQSKKIIKQKAIPANSMRGGRGPTRSNSQSSSNSSGSSRSSRSSRSNGSNSNSSNNNNTNNQKKQVQLLQKAGKINSWIFNMEQKIAQVKRIQESLQKKINKALEKTSVTLKSITELGNQDIKRLRQSISLNKRIVNDSNKQLDRLDKGKGSVGTASISWERKQKTREKKKGKWGKWKTENKKQTAKVNLGRYIYRDPATGAYQVDYKKINDEIGTTHKNKKGKTIKGDKNKAKAVKEEAEKRIKTYTDRRDNAQSAIDDATEKLEEFGKQLADTFYNWENELTRIYDLNKKLEAQAKKTERFDSILSLQDAILESGKGSKKSISLFKSRLDSLVQEIKKRATTIDQQRKEIQDTRYNKTNNAELGRVNKILRGDSTAKSNTKKAKAANKKVANDKKAIKNEKKVLGVAKSKKLASLEKKKAAATKQVNKQQKIIDNANKVIKSKNTTKKQKDAANKARKSAIIAKSKAKTRARNLEKQRQNVLGINESSKAVNKSNNKLKELNKKRKAQQDKLNKANKILNNKKSSKEQKKKAQKDKNTATKELKSINKDISTQKKIKNTNQKRIKAIKEGESAKKNLSKDKKAAKTANATNKKTQKNKISDTRRAALESYKKELAERKKINTASKKYINMSTNKDGTVNLDLDYNKLEADKKSGEISQKLYEEIKKHYEKLEEQNNNLIESYQQQTEALASLHEELGDLKQQYADRAQELLDLTEESQEKEVDKLQKLNNSLEKALKNLLDEVKRKLDERRKQEDNAKTERDISQKQQRLAALRADTSGGHQVEIAQLEKEIAEAQQSYGRTLEDQLLDRLEDQADKAAEQRERQIELLNQQLEFAKATGSNVDLINKYLANPDSYKKEIQELWRTNKDYYNQPKVIQDNLDVEWNKFWADISSGGLKDEIAALNETIKSLRVTLLETVIKQLSQRGGNKTTLSELMASTGMSKEELQNITTAEVTRSNGKKGQRYTFKDLKNMGIGLGTAVTLKKGSIDNPSAATLKAVHDAGYSATAAVNTFKNSSYSDFRKAGYSAAELSKAYKPTKSMTELGLSGATVQKGTGVSAKTLQKIVNKSPNDKATQAAMAGVQVGKVDVNGTTKGGVINDSHINATGNTVGANSGSTLYTADWDEKTGQVKGTWKKYTIGQLTEKLIKSYPIDAKEALLYAIQHTKPGSKINKNFASLTKAAGLTGKYYKLNNGIYGSISGKGWIFYNSGKKGVYKWDPATGKLAFEKYNKKNFINQAKNKNIGREYAQVLKANGVKVYKTGGLADQTGPAWLDGTPSKPELVLNAQDTKNFLALKDVLSRAMSSTSNISNEYAGDINYEVNINVDHINNDYDVDKIAKRVKENIVKDAGYRNVTQVRNLR